MAVSTPVAAADVVAGLAVVGEEDVVAGVALQAVAGEQAAVQRVVAVVARQLQTASTSTGVKVPLPTIMSPPPRPWTRTTDGVDGHLDQWAWS